MAQNTKHENVPVKGDPFHLLRDEIAHSFSSEGVKRFFKITFAFRSSTKRDLILMSRLNRDIGFKKPIGQIQPTFDFDIPIWISSRLADVCFDESVRRGVPVKAIDALVDHNVLTLSEIADHVLPRRTLDHRKRKKERLTEQESERALRIARIIAFAEDTFADTEKAATWLRRPSRLTGGRTPLDMADTEPGSRIVEEALQRIAHGIAA